MKFHLFFFCAVLLSNYYVNSVPTHSKNDESDYANLGANYNWTDLVELEFSDLIKAALINEHLHTLAVKVFKHKYSHKEIALYDVYTESEVSQLPKTEKICKVAKNRVEIFVFEMIMNTIRLFGQDIQWIFVYNTKTSSSRYKKIVTAINVYCSESLIQFELDSASMRKMMEFMTKPFKNVEYFFLQMDLNHVGNASLSMDQLFPALRQLSLKVWNSSPYLNCHLQYLEYLHVEGFYLNDLHEQGNSIEKLVQKNPQIRSVFLENVSPRFVKILQELLPSVESVHFDGVDVYDTEIYFRNVTKFEITGNFDPKKIQLPSLQAMFMPVSKENVDNWIDFLKRHTQLKQLQVFYAGLSDEQFERLTMEMQNVNDLSFEKYVMGRNIGAETIVKSIQKLNKLMNFKLDTCTKNDQQILHEKFYDEWNITKYRKCLSFERKQ